TSSSAKLVPHARVEERIDDVHAQVEQDDEEGSDEDRALHGGQVALLDGVEGQAADAGDVEDGLREDRLGEQDAEVEAEDAADRRPGPRRAGTCRGPWRTGTARRGRASRRGPRWPPARCPWPRGPSTCRA